MADVVVASVCVSFSQLIDAMHKIQIYMDALTTIPLLRMKFLFVYCCRFELYFFDSAFSIKSVALGAPFDSYK